MRNEQIQIVSEIRYRLGCLENQKDAARLWYLIGMYGDAIATETRIRDEIPFSESFEYPEAIFEIEEIKE